MTTQTLDALRALVARWRERTEMLSASTSHHVRACANDLEAVLSAALASAMTIPLPTTDDTHAVIEEGRRVSDNSASTPSDLRFVLNAAVYQLEEQREMYRARLRETEQDAKLRVRAALASASAGQARYTVNPPYRVRDGKPPIPTTHPCLYAQAQPCKELFTDPDEWCGYCRGDAQAVPLAAPPRAPETLYLLTGWRERAACLRRDGKAEASAAMDACADELRAALLRVPRAPETWKPIETLPPNVNQSASIRVHIFCPELIGDKVQTLTVSGAVRLMASGVAVTHWQPLPPPPSESRT